jgi:hypothetical protein
MSALHRTSDPFTVGGDNRPCCCKIGTSPPQAPAGISLIKRGDRALRAVGVCIASETVYASKRAARMTSTAPIVAVAIRRARSFRRPRSIPRRSRKIAPRNEPIIPVSA